MQPRPFPADARTRERSAAELPEPQSLAALVTAWQGGLDTVIVLPYSGHFARRITKRHLAVSAATRNDPLTYSTATYSTALGTPAAPGPPGAGAG